MIHLLHFRGLPITEQLALEEKLLREDSGNWCLINEGSPPTLVMGISGKPELLIDVERAKRDGIPIIKRFSGGGTVIVDENTLFVTWICQKDLHPFPPFPEPIMRWTAGVYQKAFAHPDFGLKENDFVIGNKKVGGNAQYIKKHRWLQHTSFLWDYSLQNMEYLRHPPKAPPYRRGRTHHEFLTKLSEHFADRSHLVERLKQTAQDLFPLVSCKARP